ncbi:3-oxo-5-alpha-steroid 4-dehydrogenase-domain-containing protein [Phycomyces nitens]|nr:3-oxo-5-alpha-steroid 4-dehydrogenase-domain-containing protein [Phycomyces nitens]
MPNMSTLLEVVDRIKYYWTLAETYDTLLLLYKSLPAIVTPLVCVIDAPYGRFSGQFSSRLSLAVTFSGRWSWCLMEAVSPAVFLTSVLLISSPSEWTVSQTVLTVLWLVHYINRSFVYSWRAPSIAPIHLLVSVSAAFFNVLNGYVNGVWVARYDHNPMTLWRWVGASVFVTGFVLNLYHDSILFGLRKKGSPGKRYSIPFGGLYRYVSSPNYLSEMIEWTGFMIAAWPSTPAMVFVLSTAANLIPRAWRTHAWYKHQFPDYPADRKAVIPFVF